MADRRIYNSPPIFEAVCEIRTVEEDRWDLQLPWKMLDDLGSPYTGCELTRMATVAANPVDRVGGSVSQVVLDQVDRYRLHADGKKLQCLVSAFRCGVLNKAPYLGWEEFSCNIRKALDSFMRLSESQGITRIGIRYINRINIPSLYFDVAEYFVKPHSTPDGFPAYMEDIQTSTTSGYHDHPAKLRFAFKTNKGTGDHSQFELDFDIFQDWNVTESLRPEIELVMGVVEDLREKERTAFEACITDKTRELFNA